MSLLSQTKMLFFLSHLYPEAIDALKPHLPVITEKVRKIYASSIIKTIAKKINDKEVAKELHTTGKILFDAAVEELDYDDDIFPSHPKPWYEGTIFFGPQPEPWVIADEDEEALNPQPLPPHEVKYYGAILSILADTISVEHVAIALRNIGSALIKKTQQ